MMRMENGSVEDVFCKIKDSCGVNFTEMYLHIKCSQKIEPYLRVNNTTTSSKYTSLSY